MSGSSCAHSNCEDNENEVHIIETVKDLLLDKWMNFDESFVAFNSGLTIPVPGRFQNKVLAPIIILICRNIQR